MSVCRGIRVRRLGHGYLPKMTSPALEEVCRAEFALKRGRRQMSLSQKLVIASLNPGYPVIGSGCVSKADCVR